MILAQQGDIRFILLRPDARDDVVHCARRSMGVGKQQESKCKQVVESYATKYEAPTISPLSNLPLTSFRCYSRTASSNGSDWRISSHLRRSKWRCPTAPRLSQPPTEPRGKNPEMPNSFCGVVWPKRFGHRDVESVESGCRKVPLRFLLLFLCMRL